MLFVFFFILDVWRIPRGLRQEQLWSLCVLCIWRDVDDCSDIKQLHARNQEHVKQIFVGLHLQRQQHGANP